MLMCVCDVVVVNNLTIRPHGGSSRLLWPPRSPRRFSLPAQHWLGDQYASIPEHAAVGLRESPYDDAQEEHLSDSQVHPRPH